MLEVIHFNTNLSVVTSDNKSNGGSARITSMTSFGGKYVEPMILNFAILLSSFSTAFLAHDIAFFLLIEII